ncbi:hypothetical protein QBC40DRAFT_302042 [Triangularia verruculosa]|uniref:Uncharacterized protein n=1 Tax=Triangularia verruculosa TaxID=2587418 RepID=A0AAN6X611_9PEZI|nr:hypothetical protein QBC40DRAFT_302042 [Triangularia verruculosa]
MASSCFVSLCKCGLFSRFTRSHRPRPEAYVIQRPESPDGPQKVVVVDVAPGRVDGSRTVAQQLLPRTAELEKKWEYVPAGTATGSTSAPPILCSMQRADAWGSHVCVCLATSHFCSFVIGDQTTVQTRRGTKSRSEAWSLERGGDGGRTGLVVECGAESQSQNAGSVGISSDPRTEVAGNAACFLVGNFSFHSSAHQRQPTALPVGSIP